MSEEKFLTVKLDEEGERYIFPDSTKSKFGSDTDYLVQISERDFDLAFDFAYAMTFEGKGEHNSTSFTRDSKHKRSVGEIFVNTLQGKLSELATYNYCINNGHVCNEVYFSIGKLNYWDNIDLRINEKNTSIKSTKGYSMFLCLKTLYRKRAVTWPFIFYTIIWTLSNSLKLDLVKHFCNTSV